MVAGMDIDISFGFRYLAAAVRERRSFIGSLYFVRFA